MTAPRLAPIIAALPRTVPFVGPEALERTRGRPFRARMGANESPFGPSPHAIAAMTRAAAEMNFYGDSENLALRERLAERLGLPLAALTVGEGIDGLFGTVCRLYLAPGDAVVTSLGAYPTFLYHVAAQGAVVTAVPYRNEANDLEALADAAQRTQARMVYLANPDNPTGSMKSAAEVEAFIEAVPDETLVVLDEAYAEYCDPNHLPPVSPERGNVMRFRTFSKAYGLAGMRLGYAFGHPDAIGGFDIIRNHFGVTRPGQAAALAALDDAEWLESVLARTRAGLDRIAAVARENRLTPLPSATNFLAIDCGGDGGFARAVLDGLAARDVFIRKPTAPGLDRLIRVSIGRPDEIEIFARALGEVLSELR